MFYENSAKLNLINSIGQMNLSIHSFSVSFSLLSHVILRQNSLDYSPMRSGKTSEILRRKRRSEYANKKCLLIKYYSSTHAMIQ